MTLRQVDVLSGGCEVLGLLEARPGASFVARELEERDDRWFCVVGRLSEEAIKEAAQPGWRRDPRRPRRGAPRRRPADWTATRVTVHLLGNVPRRTAGRCTSSLRSLTVRPIHQEPDRTNVWDAWQDINRPRNLDLT